MNPSHDFTKQIVDILLGAIPKGTVWAFQFVWNLAISFLLSHLLATIAILVIVLVYAFFKAVMGHWWVLGRVLYTYLYWGSVLIIGSIFGPEIFASTYADIGLFILYIICFILVGKILNKTKLK